MKDSFRHVWILIRLRWRLVFAAFTGKWGKQAAAIIGFVLITMWSLILAFITYKMIESSRDWGAAEAAAAQPVILRVAFLFTFVLQVATSVATLSVSDFFDTSRLLHLPVRARSIFAAMLLSSVLSPGTLVFGAPVFGAMAALGGPLEMQAFRVVIVIGVLLFGQATALFLGYILLGALSRRRLRDAATILGSVFGIGSYLLFRMVTNNAGRIREWVASSMLWDVLTFAPTSWFADAAGWAGLSSGAVLGVLPMVFALAASTILGAWSFSRFYESAGATSEASGATSAAPRAARFLPEDVGGVARQTLSIIWREPQLKAMLFQQMIVLVFPFLTVRSTDALEDATWWLPAVLVFSHAWLALSLLGVDGPGLRLMLQAPASRARILLGRVLALAWLFTIIDLVATGVLVLVLSQWLHLANSWALFLQLATAAIVADWVLAAAGALVSVLVPSPLVRRGKHLRLRQEGCATNLGRALLRIPVIFVGVGVGTLAILPSLLNVDPIWYALSVPGGVLLAVLAGAIAVTVGGRILEAREEQILTVMADAGD